MISKITLKLKNKELELSFEEAQELYNELSKLFEPKIIQYPIYPTYPVPLYPVYPTSTTCTTTSASTQNT